MNLIQCDEVGNRVLGFTINGKPMKGDHIQEIPDLVWASSVELLVWLSRTPEFWGAHTTSATFRVWDAGQQRVFDLQVPRKGTEHPLHRDELMGAC